MQFSGGSWTRLIQILLLGLLAGCDGGSESSFLTINLGGKEYVVEDAVFRAVPARDGVYLLELTQVPASRVPGAVIQWQMKLGSPDELAGRRLDLQALDQTANGALAALALSPDLNAHGQENSGMTLIIRSLEGGVIEGTFTGTGFVLVSMTRDESREVDVTLNFQVRTEFFES